MAAEEGLASPISDFLREHLGQAGYWAVSILFSLFVLGIILAANYHFLASISDGLKNSDFMHLWAGAKALTLGLDPYDLQTWFDLLQRYGSTWLVEDEMCLWPVWTLILFLPLSLLPVRLAGAIWMLVCEVGILAAIPLLTRALNWRVYRPYLLLMAISACLFRPSFPAILAGQIPPVLFFMLAAAFYFLRRERELWAGIILSLLIFKPNGVLLFGPAVAFFFLIRRQWWALGGMFLGVTGLFLTSWLVHPGWLFGWMRAGGKTSLTFMTPTIWGLTFDWIRGPAWIPVAATLAALISLGILVIGWWLRREDIIFSAGLALCVSIFVAPYLWSYEQVTLLFPLVVSLYWIVETPGRWRTLWILLWPLVGVGLSWFLMWIASLRGFDTLSAFVPVVTLGYFVFAFVRRRGFGNPPTAYESQPTSIDRLCKKDQH